MPRRRNRCLCLLFVPAAPVTRTLNSHRNGLEPWIEAANKRLHHNVLAIALASKLAFPPERLSRLGRGLRLHHRLRHRQDRRERQIAPRRLQRLHQVLVW